MKKNIFVLYTGGTIGMSVGNKGLSPNTALVEKALAPFARQCHFDWHVCSPLIDSSAVTLQNWHEWLMLLENTLPYYDGILVLHGTDTLAYTANLFALALQGLNKPVVLTGSQWPFDSQNSDAPANLETAIAALQLPMLKEVAIAFNYQLLPAIGSSKTSTETAEGFSNPHFGLLGQWHPESGWHNQCLSEKENNSRLSVQPININVNISCYTLIPGQMLDTVATHLTHSHAQAVILQTYGHGNAPDNEQLAKAATDYVARGGLLLNISQVMHGRTAPLYAQGAALRNTGLINGGKCNIETAVALLTLAVSRNENASWLANELQRLNLT